jgi:ATP-binding cassette, subfamily C, bacterial
MAGRPITSANSAIDVPDGPIVFCKVPFLHTEGDCAFGVQSGVHNLDLIISRGSVVGITGPSGSGKTTFADLLVRLYPPQSGEVLIGGMALQGQLLSA